MIALSALAGEELQSVDAALSALDATLELLLLRGAIGEDGVDLEDLYAATGEELQRRADEDAEYYVQLGLNLGELVEVVRHDGQIGYRPTNWPLS